MKGLYSIKDDESNLIGVAKNQNIGAPMHYHVRVEFLYILSGTSKHLIESEIQVLEADDILFVNSLEYHMNYVPDEYAECILLSIPKDFFDSVLKDYSGVTIESYLLDKEFNRKIKAILTQMLLCSPDENLIFERAEMRGYDPRKEVMIRGYTYLIIGMIFSHYKLKANKKTADNKITEILKYINKNIATDISRTSLAQEFGYSENYFSLLFKNSFGMNISEYVNMIRVNEVQNRIISDESPNLLQTIFDVGFNSVSAYYRALKKFKK